MTTVSIQAIKLSEDERFCKIKSTLLLSISPLRGDIYVRLSQDKFVKLFSKGDTFEVKDLEKYTVQKKIEYLYILKTDLRDFLDRYNVDLYKYVKASVELKSDQAAKITKNCEETIKEAYDRIGFTKEVQELTKTQAQIMIKTIGATPSLKGLLSRIKIDEGDYVYSHSMLTGYISCAIANKLDWGSKPTYFKINFAAIMHDIALKDIKLAKYDTVSEAIGGGCSKEELKDFMSHPQIAANLVNECKDSPPGVAEIILQHHEKMDGSGFPKKIGQRYIAPLSVVFIIGHEMAEEILKNGSLFDSKDFVEQLKSKYTGARIQKIIAAVEKSLN